MMVYPEDGTLYQFQKINILIIPRMYLLIWENIYYISLNNKRQIINLYL